MNYRIHPTIKFNDWFEKQTEKSKVQIEKRLEKIRDFGHFGHFRQLDNELYELKFTDGRRIYYIIIPVNNVILLLGGCKNGQESDIQKARNAIQKAKENAKKRT